MARLAFRTALLGGVAMSAALAAASAAQAVPVTFAQFTEVQTGSASGSGAPQNLVFTRNKDGSATLNTANKTLGDDVFFSFKGYETLPDELVGQQRAHLKINGGAGVTTTAPVVSSSSPGTGTLLSQPFNTDFTLSFTRDTPFVPTFGPLVGRSLTNLLTVTLGTLDGVSPVLSGYTGTRALAGTFDQELVKLTFSSDFLDFSDVHDRNAAVSFSAVVNSLLKQGSLLRDFRGDVTGTFAADPVPRLSFAVPEPASMALFGVGLLGLALVRRRAA